MTSSPTPWWSKDTIAVVTGSNKGIGYEIARQLAEKGVTVVFTARDPAKGQAAVDALKAKETAKDWYNSIRFHQLDVCSSESVETLAAWLKKEFGGIDILVNNAGIGRGPRGTELVYENVKAIMDTNYYGVKRVTDGLLPLLRPGGRILSITSGMALYSMLRSEKLKQTFRDEDSYTLELVDSLATKLIEDVKAGRYDDEEGWAGVLAPMYGDSKILLNAYEKVLARSLSKSQREDHQIFVVIVSPGVTLTDLLTPLGLGGSNYKPPAGFKLQTPAEGADTGVWVALLPKEEMASKHGKIWHDRKEYDWGRSTLAMK